MLPPPNAVAAGRHFRIASAALILGAVLAGPLARPAAAGLIGDTVTFNGQSAVITGNGTTFDTTNPASGVPFTASFTGNSVTLVLNHQVADNLFAAGTFSFGFTFAHSTVTGVQYLSGTLPALAPQTPLDPCGEIADPNTFCTGFVNVVPQMDFAEGSVDGAHSITLDLGSFNLSPDTVTFEIDTAIPEPTGLAFILAPLALLLRRRRTVAEPGR
jgi:hypothetical protein